MFLLLNAAVTSPSTALSDPMSVEAGRTVTVSGTYLIPNQTPNPAVGSVDAVFSDDSTANVKQISSGPTADKTNFSGSVRVPAGVSTMRLKLSATTGGIQYNDLALSYSDTGVGLVYPISYGTAGSTQNQALLYNMGSSTAFPVLTVTGPFPNGVLIAWGDNKALQYDGAVGMVPLVLDSRPGAQNAMIGGQDVSRQLSRRDFPVVPAGGSISLRLLSSGTGWVTCSVRDTFI